MSAKQIALSHVTIVMLLSGVSACGTVQDSQVSQISSGDSAERLRQERLRNTTVSILQDSAGNILKCFHPSQALIDVSVDQIKSNGNLGTASGNILMRGFLNRYNMAVTLAYDSSDDTVRVEPGISNTMFPAKADCALRSWVKVDHIGLAARQAASAFHAQVAGAVAIGLAAGAASRSQRASSSGALNDSTSADYDEYLRERQHEKDQQQARDNHRKICKSIYQSCLASCEGKSRDIPGVFAHSDYVNCRDKCKAC